MNYAKFILYNIVGGIAWVAMFVFGGYWFGNIEFVKKNFSLVVIAIIIISVMPMVVEFISHETPRQKQIGQAFHAWPIRLPRFLFHKSNWRLLCAVYLFRTASAGFSPTYRCGSLLNFAWVSAVANM